MVFHHKFSFPNFRNKGYFQDRKNFPKDGMKITEKKKSKEFLLLRNRILNKDSFAEKNVLQSVFEPFNFFSF